MDTRTRCQPDVPPQTTAERSRNTPGDKTKQTKSRNGCSTCKRKRLRCDETKPVCNRCLSKDLVCEGYQQELRWKIVDNEKARRSRRRNSRVSSGGARRASRIKAADEQALTNESQSRPLWLGGSPPTSFDGVDVRPASPLDFSYIDFANNELMLPATSLPLMPGLTPTQSSPVDDYGLHSLTSASPDMTIVTVRPLSPNDPWLRDEDVTISNARANADVTDVRQHVSLDNVSLSSTRDVISHDTGTEMDRSSPDLDPMDMLMLRFDQKTCSMLSVTDGSSENPWRTLILPLAHHSPALFHAIAAMTAFHGAFEESALHTIGMAHMTRSIRLLGGEIQRMHLDSALATSIALAFSEGWDSHVSTGIHHLHAAKVMLHKLAYDHQTNACHPRLLRFLCNTFIYMDVIARLTQMETSVINHEQLLSAVNSEAEMKEVDPMMGCAMTLFPLLGRIGNLVQQVRKTKENSLTAISSALEMQEELQEWKPPVLTQYEHFEGRELKVQHLLLTAEAYRHAALLYLHQAVPEVPSPSARDLAKRVLVLIASVPPSSRATGIQIFPLFVASCEIDDAENRRWVMKRWTAMIDRLKIGNLKSCWTIVQEVWNRRDVYHGEKLEQASPDRIDTEFTVRGRLHWLGVMAEWNWEVFL